MICGRNELSSPNANEIVEKLNHAQTVDETYQPFGDGYSAVKIVKAMEEYHSERK